LLELSLYMIGVIVFVFYVFPYVAMLIWGNGCVVADYLRKLPLVIKYVEKCCKYQKLF
jgi:hypothetical protein